MKEVKYISSTTSYLPSVYRQKNINNSKLLDKVIDSQTDKGLKYVTEYKLQRVVNTATWGLATWEEELGLPVPCASDIETRRAIILSRIRGAGTTTKQKIERLGEEFSGAKVEVDEQFEKFHVRILFSGMKGVPENLHIFIDTVEELLPSHLSYEFVYSYLTWDEFDNYNYTWDIWDSKNLTWSEFEEYDGR